jgi:hypothetical protein
MADRVRDVVNGEVVAEQLSRTWFGDEPVVVSMDDGLAPPPTARVHGQIRNRLLAQDGHDVPTDRRPRTETPDKVVREEVALGRAGHHG